MVLRSTGQIEPRNGSKTESVVDGIFSNVRNLITILGLTQVMVTNDVSAYKQVTQSRSRSHQLISEIQFRIKIIRRIYPSAKLRVAYGGLDWDVGQGKAVYVIIDDNVEYDEELTYLHRALDNEPEMRNALKLGDKALADSPVKHMRQAVILLYGCACFDKFWESSQFQDCLRRLRDEPE